MKSILGEIIDIVAGIFPWLVFAWILFGIYNMAKADEPWTREQRIVALTILGEAKEKRVWGASPPLLFSEVKIEAWLTSRFVYNLGNSARGMLGVERLKKKVSYIIYGNLHLCRMLGNWLEIWTRLPCASLRMQITSAHWKLTQVGLTTRERRSGLNLC